MKILLGIFCGLMVLFAGGCALILVAEGTYPSGGGMVPLAAFPAAVAALNVLVLAALFGKAHRVAGPSFSLRCWMALLHWPC